MFSGQNVLKGGSRTKKVLVGFGAGIAVSVGGIAVASACTGIGISGNGSGSGCGTSTSTVAVQNQALTLTGFGTFQSVHHRRHHISGSCSPTTTTLADTTTSATISPSSSTTVKSTTTTSFKPTTTTAKSTTSTTPTTVGESNGSKCATSPSSCGFPDATNTGASSSLPTVSGSGNGWRSSGGSVTITGSGATFSGFKVNGIDVQASNVTIKNVYIDATHESANNSDFGIALRHSNSVTIQNVTIKGSSGSTRLMVGIKDIYGDVTATVIKNCDISGTSTGIQMTDGDIENNYIHDMGMASGDHINGTTSNAGAIKSLLLQHNTVFNQFSQTDAISLFEDFGAEHGVTINDNLVAGGGYSIYGGQNAGGPTATNIKITNNKFSTKFYAKGGYWGPMAAIGTGSGDVTSGNTWIDGPNQGKAVS